MCHGTTVVLKNEVECVWFWTWTLQIATGPTTLYLDQFPHLCDLPDSYNHLLFQPQLKLSPSSIVRKISSKILASLISQLCDLELVAYNNFELPLILFYKMLWWFHEISQKCLVQCLPHFMGSMNGIAIISLLILNLLIANMAQWML